MSLVSFGFINYGAEQLPRRMHPEDAGMDVFAPYDIIIKPGEIVNVPLGFGMTMPPGYMAYVTARGSTAKQGFFIAENPIDSNYRGEVHATLAFFGTGTAAINRGSRFAQVVVVPCICGESTQHLGLPPSWPVMEPNEAPASDRGTGHHGSTNTPVKPKPSDPLDRAGEVVTLKVIGKPAPLSYPWPRKHGSADISSTYDQSERTVTVRCEADVVTLGITIKVLQQQYAEACSNIAEPILTQINKVIEEVINSGQD